MPAQIISKRIQEILTTLGWTKEYLAEKSNLPLETVKNIYYGRTKDPHVSTLDAIADATGYSINCLMGKCQHTTEEKILLRNYRACGEHGKAIIDLIGRYEAGAVKDEREAVGEHTIPCVFPSGSIYNGILYDLSDTKDVWTSVPEAFSAIKMMDNELAPYFCKGDTILFENRFPQNGEFAGFFRNGKAYIRRFIEEDNQYRLKCLHNRGEDIILKRMDEIQYIGTCCGVSKKP